MTWVEQSSGDECPHKFPFGGLSLSKVIEIEGLTKKLTVIVVVVSRLASPPWHRLAEHVSQGSLQAR